MTKPISNLSVIIATRYASEYLKLCIETMNKHSDYDNEYIIVADLPSHQTLKYLQENNMPYILTNFGHQGLVWNSGAQYATREYLAITGDDIVVGPNWDSALLEVAKPNVVGCLSYYDPNMSERLRFEYKAGDIKTFNFDKFMYFGNESKRAESVQVIDPNWPIVVHKDMFFKYGGITFHSGRGHGHDIQLGHRIAKNEGGKMIRNERSFVFHFGPSGNRDNVNMRILSRELQDGIKICARCFKYENGFGGNETHSESREIIQRGYWLCNECRDKNIPIRQVPLVFK